MVNRLSPLPAPSFPLKSRLPIALVAAGLLFAVSSFASASPITYTVSGTTVLKGASEAVNGTFTYDPTTKTQSSADIILTGPAPYAGVYSDSLSALTSGTTISAPLTHTPEIELLFASPLGNAPDQLTGVIWLTLTDFAEDLTTTTGSAVPTNLPEPTSFTILGLALGLLPLGRRFSRNRKH